MIANPRGRCGCRRLIFQSEKRWRSGGCFDGRKQRGVNSQPSTSKQYLCLHLNSFIFNDLRLTPAAQSAGSVNYSDSCGRIERSGPFVPRIGLISGCPHALMRAFAGPGFRLFAARLRGPGALLLDRYSWICWLVLSSGFLAPGMRKRPATHSSKTQTGRTAHAG